MWLPCCLYKVVLLLRLDNCSQCRRRLWLRACKKINMLIFIVTVMYTRKIKHISRSVAVNSVEYISDLPVEETRMIIVVITIFGTAQAVSTPVVTLFSATISLYLRRSLIKIQLSVLIKTIWSNDAMKIQMPPITDTVSNLQNGPRLRTCLISDATNKG